MKATVILSMIGIVLMSFTGYSQNVKINLSVKDNTTLIDVFKQIEEQSEFFFYFKNEELSSKSVKPFDVQDGNIAKVLDNILQDTGLEYRIIDRYIVVKEKGAGESMLNTANAVKQGITVTGTVTDNGSPMPGVNVTIKGTASGTVTDINGKYSVTVPDKGTILVFSFVGYMTNEITVGDQTVINILLDEDTREIEEVVVVGYGTQKKATLTGSVTQVSGKDIQQSPAANLSNSLAGRMPGVIVNNRWGEPGSDGAEIYIRGKGTLGNSSPLYVIDGVANRDGIERLNPSDIETISVLKDASAAIYGAQAANGVILVTTKRGSADSKPVISYDGSFGLTGFTKRIDFMDAYQYMTYVDEINERYGITQQYKDIKEKYLDGTIDPLQYTDTKWMDAVFAKLAPQTQHSLSIRGGNDRVRYYVSGGFLYQKPQYVDTEYDFKTFQIRSNIDARITKNLDVTVEIAARQENRHNPSWYTGTIFTETCQAYPFLYAYYPNGLPGPGIEWGNNPALLAKGVTGYDDVVNLFLNTKIGIDLKLPWITQGLSLSGFIAYDPRFQKNKRLRDQWDAYQYNPATGEYDNNRSSTGDGTINLTQGSSDENITSAHLRLSYIRNFAEFHNVSGFVAYEQSKGKSEWFDAYRRDFLSDKVPYLFAGSDNMKTNNGGAGNVFARQNIFGRLNYDFKGRYMAEFTLRYDGSQNFESKDRWGWFPGISAGWRISDETFFKIPFINNLKIKASWGKLGNDRIDPFQYLDLYSIQDGPQFGINPIRQKGFSNTKLGNPLVTWEKVDTKNIGFESLSLNSRLQLDFQYFYSYRTDILVQRTAAIPGYSGLDGGNLPPENIGEVSVRGIEIEAMYREKVNNFQYYIGGNFTWAKNRREFFAEAEDIPEWQKQTGHQIDSWLVYLTDGIYKTKEEVDNSPHLLNTLPGDIQYRDIDEDGDITDNDRVRIYESALPEIVYGITLGAQWKGFELNALLSGQARAKQLLLPNGRNRNIAYYEGRWTKENPNATYPRAFNAGAATGDDLFNAQSSDFWLKNASFLRMKNLEIAYNIPSSFLHKINMNSMKIYLSGYNLFTIIDHIKIQDPEGTDGAGTNYPQLRIYSIGVNLSF